jgi:hypothetical protein
MKKLLPLLSLVGLMVMLPSVAFAAGGTTEVTNFTQDALGSLMALAGVAVVFFLVRGGYLYMTSSGNPGALEEAKRTIHRALIGLVIVLGAGVLASLLSGALTGAGTGGGTALTLQPIQPAPPDGSLAQLLLDAVAGFLKNIVTSATKPILDGITGFLTNTPSLSTNSVVFNFWLIMVGITDSLFAVVIALLGFQVMSASTFGLEDVSLKELFPKIALAFIAANTSIFLIDWIIDLCQAMVHGVLTATGGIGQAWILNAFDPASLLSGSTALITLIFMVVFIVLAIILLLFYISRLMLLALGAVMAPLICLLWLVPSMSGYAVSSFKSYLVTIFSVFVHVVIIQLASAFLTVPGQMGTNPLISIFIGVALFSILLKSTANAMQLVLASQAVGSFKKFGSTVLNVLSAKSIAGKIV